MQLYSSKMIEEFNNKKKKGFKISFYPLIIIIPLFVLFLIVANLKTKSLYIFLSTLDLSIFGILFTYNLIENIIKSNDLIKHVSSVLNGYTQEVSGEIISISKEMTLKRNIHIVEVCIKKDNNTLKTYFNIDFFENNFKVGDSIKCKLSNNFISEYEV